MTDRELFTKSHEALIDLMSWVNKPIILVERGAVDNDALRSFEKGNIVFTYDNRGITTLNGGMQEDLVRKVVETFLESHRKI